MTNSTNASLQWEVAGGKKITTRKVNTELNGAKLTNGKQAVNGKQDFISKIPKLATSRNITFIKNNNNFKMKT